VALEEQILCEWTWMWKMESIGGSGDECELRRKKENFEEVKREF